MEIRLATLNDIDAIVNIYSAILTQEEQGLVSIGWDRTIYPQRKHALDALEKKELYVLTDHNQIVGSGRINQTQVPEYRNAHWHYPAKDEEIMVLHTLTINPAYAHHGYGKYFVKFYEEFAKIHQCPYLRMDTNAINQRARKLYHGLGYSEADIVPCVFNGIEGVQLVCLEKKIQL